MVWEEERHASGEVNNGGRLSLSLEHSTLATPHAFARVSCFGTRKRLCESLAARHHRRRDAMASFGKFRFLTLIKPVLHILPEVAPPDRKIPFKARHSLAARSAGR